MLYKLCYLVYCSALSLELHHVTSLHLNDCTSSLLVGTHYLGMFEFKNSQDSAGNLYTTTHDGLCTQATYNPLFDLVRQLSTC